MTLSYPPKRGPEWGTEYCETHVEAHFGVVVDQNGVEHAKGQVPVEHKNTGQLYEHFQVQELRKWAPVRSYHRIIPEGIGGKRWRLWVDMLTRHRQEVGQPFALVLTISDPEKKRPVYNQLSVKLANRLASENLALRPQVRNRLIK